LGDQAYDLIKETKMTPETSLAYIEKTANDLGVGHIADEVIGDGRFYLWSGSSRREQHHYGKHGLVRHTAEVIMLCLANDAILGCGMSTKELFLAALFHDCGKMWDYEPDGSYEVWGSAPHKRSIHHISRSAIQWNLAAEKWNLAKPATIDDFVKSIDVDEITHAILAHHGQRAWGSPVAPKSGLAWMLHLCDGISARMNDCDSWDPYSGAK
jgi:3'-5' exoribonuclease